MRMDFIHWIPAEKYFSNDSQNQNNRKTLEQITADMAASEWPAGGAA